MKSLFIPPTPNATITKKKQEKKFYIKRKKILYKKKEDSLTGDWTNNHQNNIEFIGKFIDIKYFHTESGRFTRISGFWKNLSWKKRINRKILTKKNLNGILERIHDLFRVSFIDWLNWISPGIDPILALICCCTSEPLSASWTSFSRTLSSNETPDLLFTISLLFGSGLWKTKSVFFFLLEILIYFSRSSTMQFDDDDGDDST